ncbi:hypothetical protein TNCV_343351 [Trichonephila clavipes]|nr:hypothetical protein TNCV_343351 [Trichonephila clavipes]
MVECKKGNKVRLPLSQFGGYDPRLVMEWVRVRIPSEHRAPRPHPVPHNSRSASCKDIEERAAIQRDAGPDHQVSTIGLIGH